MIVRYHNPNWRDTFFEEHHDTIHKISYRFRLNFGEQDDLIKDAFVRIVETESAHKVMEGPDSTPYVYVVAKHIVIDQIKNRRSQHLSGGDTMGDVIKLCLQPEVTETGPLDLPRAMVQALSNVKARTKPRAWAMFWQTVANGRSCRDVARELGAGYSTVKTKGRYVRLDIVREYASLTSSPVGTDGLRPWEKIMPETTVAELADGGDWHRSLARRSQEGGAA